jgi:DUF4097 and DUF4098 domain-containing protein YvlB
LTALLACSACVDLVSARMDARYVEREEKRFQTSGKPEVTLGTFDGSIEIRPWDKAEVEVVVEKRGADKNSIAELQIEATQSGDRISVEVKNPHRRTGIHFGPSPSAKLIVSLPASSDVTARSGDGSIDVERLAGRIELRSGDGSIRARDLAGDVTVQTGDGSIALDGKFSAVRARSGDGSVRVHAAPGTSAGADWDISTGDGSVTLEIPDGFNAELDAHTGDGGVHVEDVAVSNVTGEIRRNSIRGRLGSGGHEVRVRTGDGSITVRRS